MAKEIFESPTNLDDFPAKEVPVKERDVACVFVSDGVYKYIYVDTGEDVNP